MTSRGASGAAAGRWSAVVLLLVVVAGLLPGLAVDAGPGVRYLDAVFADVVVTPDQQFRTADDCTDTPVDLALDLYEPAGDTETARPLYVWIHGGSFSSGDKDGALEVAVAEDFARRGYVVASIQYRLCASLTLETITDAAEDAAAAVAWLRSHASELRVDPTRVAVGGASAGAITATFVGYAPDRSLGEGGEDDPAHADAVVSIAGTGPGPAVEAGEPSLFMAHGTDDPIIDISLALDFCAAVDAAGPGCEFHEYPAGHESLVAFFDDIEAALFVWLYGALDLAPPPASAPTATTTTPSSVPTTTTVAGAAAGTTTAASPARVATPIGGSPVLTG